MSTNTAEALDTSLWCRALLRGAYSRVAISEVGQSLEPVTWILKCQRHLPLLTDECPRWRRERIMQVLQMVIPPYQLGDGGHDRCRRDGNFVRHHAELDRRRRRGGPHFSGFRYLLSASTDGRRSVQVRAAAAHC